MSIDNTYISKDLTIKVKQDDVKLSTKPYVFKGDTGIIFEISINNWNYYFDRSPNSEVDIFNSECKAMIEIVRPDGKLTKLMDVPIVDNEIQFKINKNISDLVGIYQIYIKITKGRVVIATLPPFEYEVKDKPYFNNILPSDRGFLQTEDETLLCYDTLDDYGIKHISELTKTENEKDEDELVLQQDGVTTCITVGDFLKTTRDTAKEYTDTTATTIRGEVSDLDTEHKNLVKNTKDELTELINQKDSSQSNALEGAKNELTELITEKDTAQTDALNLAKDELNQTITEKHKEARGYTDTEVASAKSHSDTNLDTAKKYTDAKTVETLNSAKEYSDAKLVEGKNYSDQKLVESKNYSNTKLVEGKEYTDTKSIEALNNAKKYSDAKLTEGNGYTDAEIVKAKSYSDSNLADAKGYTDSEIGKTKVELKAYSDSNLKTGKSYTDSEISKVNNTATANLTDAKKYTDDKLIEGKGYTDTKIKELVGLAPNELDTIEELATAYQNNKDVLDATGVELSKKADKIHEHDIATESANGFMSKEDFTKLKGIADGANNYTHPKTHQASIIVQDASHRFITDEEREKWTNLKIDNVSIEGQEIVFKAENVEKFRLPLPKGFSGDYNDLINQPQPYVLPIASDSALGGIKLGIGFEKQEDGTVNVVSGGKADSVEWSGILNKPAEFNPTIASTTKLGGVKVGEGLVITDDGTLSANVKQINWDGIQGKPSKFDPSTHTHTKSEIVDMFKVENSLTSNSATNALSVQQGKVIDNKVNTLRGEYDSTVTEVSSLKEKSHTHSNKTELDKISIGKVDEWDSKAEGSHTHTLDHITNMFRVENTLTSDNANNALSSAQGKILNEKVNNVEKKVNNVHTHNNKSTLDKITEQNLADWNAKETVQGSQTKATKSLEDSKAYVDEKTTELREFVNNQISENLGRETFKTTVSEWTQDDNLYKTNIIHHLNSEDVIVCCTEKSTKENILISYKVIDENTIELMNDSNAELDVMIIAGALRKIEPTYGAEIDDRTIEHDKTWSSEKIEREIGNQQVVVNALDQFILTGAFSASPSIGVLNWVWNSEKAGKTIGMLLPDYKDLFESKTDLDSILNDVTTRDIVINNAGIIDTLMSQYGVKRKFIEKIDVVIAMLKSDVSKDYILSDKDAIRDILNSVDDFNKFFTAFKEDEKMRFNILNSDYPYLREKMNSNQDVITYWLNYGNQDSFLAFKQLFADTQALNNATTRNGLQYSYLEFVFILQNIDYYKNICTTGVLDGYVKSKDARIHALLWNIKELTDSVLSNETLCDSAFANEIACEKIFTSELATDKLFTMPTNVDKVLASKTACNKLFASEMACVKAFASNEIYTKILASAIASEELSKSEIACNKVFDSANLTTKAFESTTTYDKLMLSELACKKIFSKSELYNKVFTTDSLYDKVVLSQVASKQMFASGLACDRIFAFNTLYNKAFAQKIAYDEMFVSSIACNKLFAKVELCNIVFASSPMSKKIFSSDVACDELYASQIACERLATFKVACDELALSELACNKLVVVDMACEKLFANQTACDSLFASQMAYNKIFASNIAYNKLILSQIACQKVFTTNELCNIVFVSNELFDKALASSIACNKIFASGLACDKICESNELFEKIFASDNILITAMSSQTMVNKTFANANLANKIITSPNYMQKLFASSVACDKLFASSVACDKLFASSVACDKLFASDNAIKKLCESKVAVVKWIKSSTAKNSAQNNNTIQKNVYLKTLYNTVESCVSEGKLNFYTSSTQDGVASLNNQTRQANALVLCCLGTYSSSSAYTNLFHPNGKKATRGNTNRPSSVTASNVNGVSFTNCTFTEDSDGYASIRVYTAK